MSPIHVIAVTFFTFFTFFFENPKNVTFYFFWFASHVFSNYVENRQFVPTPPSFNALAQGDPLRILG